MHYSENRREAVLFYMAVLQRGSPWGELLTVGRLRWVVLMHIFYFVELLSVIAARCHIFPRRGFIVLQSNILKAAFS